MATDHYFGIEVLQEMAARVEAGLPLAFNRQQVEQLSADIAHSQTRRARFMFYLYVYGFFAVPLILLGLLIWWMAS